jgi:hypothetical protein
MPRIVPTIIAALAVAGTLTVASPAFAFYWSCMAKDAKGAEYEGKSFGLISPWARAVATDRAIGKCEEAGGKSCKLKDCIDLDVQPRT